MADKNITIVFPEELVDALDALGRELNVSRSTLIRRATLIYLPTARNIAKSAKDDSLSTELLHLLAGAPIRQLGDETDEEIRQAFEDCRALIKSNKSRKRRPGRPRTT